ncbi:type I secretion system permease/ATPase [Breoghania sp. L-A4]|uniref:type I secretion system permease/ATPase n=1 Tax=Breoghania sp. L-A4 TaxID=2304600 RepID=UPI000E35807B|nr:type I secretion system permease/ATPase [Breoghania sp. L-A4]AXS42134.1 type I secretion system permease/ATPase [Breoghania sp. L-A4]
MNDRFADPAEAAPAASLPSSGTANGLLEALVHVARAHGRPASGRDVLRGLPADPQGLPLTALEEAAGKLGLTMQLRSMPVSRIPPVTLPVIVHGLSCAAGRAAVLTRLDARAGTAEIIVPSIDETARTIDIPALSDASGTPENPVVFLTPGQSGTASGTPEDRGSGHWFWSAVRRLWPNYMQVVVAALIGNLLGLASPLFIMNVYDRVIPNLAIPTLWALTAGVAIAFGFDFLLKLLRMRIVEETGRRVDMAVAGRIFDHLMTMKLAGRPDTTGATANQVRDFDTVRDALTSSSVIALTDLMFIGIFLWVMWLLVGPLVAVPGGAVPLVIIVTGLIQIPLARALRTSQGDVARRQSLLVETLSALETVKAVGGESWLRRAWDRAVAAASRSTARARGWANLATSFTGLVQQSVSIVIVVWGVFLVLEGEISVGALIAANILAGRVLAPLANIAQTLARLHQARAALQGLEQIMGADAERRAPASDIAPSPGADALRFETVSFTYPRAAGPALSGISFTVRPGERIGIIGPVGSGKSTLSRLIAGLYEPGEGAYLLNGVDARQYSTAALRGEIGLCLQDAELFTGTLRDNIIIGNPFASDTAIERAVRLSGVARFSAQHPLGLAMAIEEGGRSLSGGQRQAVSIARCLIRDPKILFLDEPSAGMDVSTEQRLVASLREIAQAGIALMIATHRDGPLDVVDRLLVFDRGRLVMDGPKAQVIERLRTGAAP